MSPPPRQVTVFGSTGSIGCAALEVIEASRGRLKAIALSAHSNFQALVKQAQQVRPRWVIATDEQAASQFDWSALPDDCELLVGEPGLTLAASHPQVDVVLAAIVGSAGLQSTWAAVDAGKHVALANKETLVAAGTLMTARAAETDAVIVPVDSEHSAVFQALQAGRREELQRIVLTASGGPFRNHTAAQLEEVTVAEALAHPTWEMGAKITIDSATMMNKALEIIEARWLFDLSADQISIVIHPQSIVHSLVEFVDGSVIAQLSPPDMKLPIQYALEYPHRQRGIASRLDWSDHWSLEFEPPDFERFPALELGLSAARSGGSTGVVLSAANEMAVAGFLEGELRFTEIVSACRSVLDHHDYDPAPTMEELWRLDRWAREEVNKWVCA